LKTEIINLRVKNIESCHACGKCAKIKKCKIYDGLNEIIGKIRDSKGLIIGTPYISELQGGLDGDNTKNWLRFNEY
jgi:multimeric flavodoxin WrbA